MKIKRPECNLIVTIKEKHITANHFIYNVPSHVEKKAGGGGLISAHSFSIS